jgi:hypothetical protein
MKGIAGVDRIVVGSVAMPNVLGGGTAGADLGLWIWDVRRLRSFVVPSNPAPIQFEFEVGIGGAAPAATASKGLSWVAASLNAALLAAVPGASGGFQVSMSAATPGGWQACTGGKQRVWVNWSATLSAKAGASLPGVSGNVSGHITLTGRVPEWEAECECVAGVGAEQALEEWLKDLKKFSALLQTASTRDGEIGFNLSGTDRSVLLASVAQGQAVGRPDVTMLVQMAAATPIESLQLPVEVTRALRESGFKTISDLAAKIKQEPSV